jgi:hypothetical protein
MTLSRKTKIVICVIVLAVCGLASSPFVHEYDIELGGKLRGRVIQARRIFGYSNIPQGIRFHRAEYFGPGHGYQLSICLGPVGCWWDFIKLENY